MHIIFKKVRYKNFLSTGNTFTEIDMVHSPKTLIHGTNGSGKTTFVDAVFFALYGKSFRKVKKNSVVNYINKKKAVVELEFQIRTDQYKIIRGVKPNVFEIFKNDKIIDKESTTTEYQRYLETFILHMNEKLFTQTVLLGSTNYTPFMLLSTSDRRNVIESLLDIQIFSVMNDLAKSENKTLQTRYNNTEYLIEKADITIEHLQNHIDGVKGNQQDLIDATQRKIDACDANVNTYQDEIRECIIHTETHETVRDAVGDRTNIKQMITSVQQYKKQFEGLIHSNNNKIEFYSTNDECPTCTQHLSQKLKNLSIKDFEMSNQNFDEIIIKAVSTITEKENLLQRYDDSQTRADEFISSAKSWQRKLDAENKSIQDHNETIAEIKKGSDITYQENQVEESKKGQETNKKNLEEATQDILNYSTILELLKDDGIKTRIVKTYIPVINKLIKQYLDILDFPIMFKFDESFNEYIKFRGRDEVTFANLSEGERMRVNLALIFAFRELAKIRNATHCNLIIFDEVADSSLDTTGWDSFLKILKDVCTDGNQNTFIISHKGDAIINKFDRDIRFAKKGGRFSSVV